MTDGEREDRWSERMEAHFAAMQRHHQEFAQMHQQLRHRLMLLHLKLSNMRTAHKEDRKQLEKLLQDIRKSREETRRRLGIDFEKE